MAESLKNRKIDKAGNSVALLHISVMLFGFAAVLGQFVEVPAVIIAGGRVVCSSVTLLIFSLVTKSDRKLGSKKDYGIAVLTGVVLAIHWTTFFSGHTKFFRGHRHHYFFCVSTVPHIFGTTGIS